MTVSYKGLFKILDEKKLNLTQMSKDLAFSSKTRAKFTKGEYVSLQTIESICNYLNVPIEQVVKFEATQKHSIMYDQLYEEMMHKIKGGIYHETQILMTYNSNHIEGSKLTAEQTRYIFETNTIGLDSQKVINIDDIIETQNHFRCIDYIIKTAFEPLSEQLIKDLHKILKSGTSDAKLDWFNVGEYKARPNTVGGIATSSPIDVSKHLSLLIRSYENRESHQFEEIIDFHYEFECIHPFQDGNGRVGRLIAFKECLRNGIISFTIDEDLKLFYYRGLKEWKNEKGYLIDTCLSGQDKYKNLLDMFQINY